VLEKCRLFNVKQDVGYNVNSTVKSVVTEQKHYQGWPSCDNKYTQLLYEILDLERFEMLE